AVTQDAGERIVDEDADVAGAVPDLRADPLQALRDHVALLVEGLLGRAPVRAREVDLLRRHSAGADHPGRPGGRALDVAADPGRVLAVEDALGGHRAERPDQLRLFLRAPGAEALLLLARLVVAERRAAPFDREPGGLGA